MLVVWYLPLHSLPSSPFQPLQCCVNFIRANRGLAIVTVAAVHEYGAVLQSFLDNVKLPFELRSLFDCQRMVVN